MNADLKMFYFLESDRNKRRNGSSISDFTKGN